MWMPRSQTIPKPEDVCRLSGSGGFALDATLSSSEDVKICDSKADSEWEYGWNMVYLCNLCVFLQWIPKQVVLLGFFTTHSNPTGRASAVVSPFGSAGLRSPSASLHHTRNATLLRTGFRHLQSNMFLEAELSLQEFILCTRHSGCTWVALGLQCTQGLRSDECGLQL